MNPETDTKEVPLFGELIQFDLIDSGFLELECISPDEICNSVFHNEPIWRCATLIAPAPAPEAFSAHIDQPSEYIGRPVLKRDCSNNTNLASISSQVSAADYFAPKANHLTPPEIPLLLMPTHFEVDCDLPSLLLLLDETLHNFVGLSFEHTDFEWTMVYCNGPTHCKLQMHLYTGFSKGYIVETNKLNGDTILFRSVFNQLKVGLAPDCGESEYDSYAVFTPLPMPTSILRDNEDCFGLGPVFRMARSCFIEAQLEACRTLCDLSAEESMRAHLCSLGGVEILRDLLHSSSEWVKHHATIALANLSDSQPCHTSIIASGVLPVLLNLSTETSFFFAEIRVLVVYILANVSSRLAESVIANLGAQAVSEWMEHLNNQTDERLRLHVTRARDQLSRAIVF